jgi:hypothetical protein
LISGLPTVLDAIDVRAAALAVMELTPLGRGLEIAQLGVHGLHRVLGADQDRGRALAGLADRQRGLVQRLAQLQQRHGQEKHQQHQGAGGDQGRDASSRHAVLLVDSAVPRTR